MKSIALFLILLVWFTMTLPAIILVWPAGILAEHTDWFDFPKDVLDKL